jgi:hypothetical protein
VAASALFATLLLYVFFSGYLPARSHAVRLERELRGLYGREASLQNQLVQAEQRLVTRERELGQRVKILTAERDRLHAEREQLLSRLEILERPPAVRPRRR